MSTVETRSAPSVRASVARAALVTGPLFLAEVALNSWLSRDYLHAHGWALRGGDDLPWPSMLALGPHGWAQVAGFAIAGTGVLCAVPALARALPARRRRTLAVAFFSILGLAVLLSAARVDASMIAGDDPSSWHGWMHGLMFLVLLPTTVLTPLLVAWAAWGDPGWRNAALLSAFTPLLVIGAFASGQGNLGFYLFLCVVFGWAATVAATATRLSGPAAAA